MSCQLGGKVAAAQGWFEEKGLESIAELKEAEMEDEFVQALHLKKGRARILRTRIAKH